NEIQPSLLLADSPVIPLVRLDVEHRKQIRREHSFLGVVDGQLAGKIDAAAHPPKMLAERVTGAALRTGVSIPFWRLGALDLRWQRIKHPLSMFRTERLPNRLGWRSRIQRIDPILWSGAAHPSEHYNGRRATWPRLAQPRTTRIRKLSGCSRSPRTLRELFAAAVDRALQVGDHRGLGVGAF